VSERPYDVLVVGGTGVDTIVRVDALEVPPGDSLFVPPVRDYVGHTGNGVALGWHALGLATKFIDFLGDDIQGRQVLAAYAEQGLDFSHVLSPHGTPRGINLVDPAGRRFSFYDGRHPADLRLPRPFYLPFLERARHVHLSIVGHNRDMYEDVHRLGVTSSTDLHDWDGRNPHHRHYALASDYVFLSAAALGDRLEEVMHRILDEGRARLVVATAGAAGCHLLVRGDKKARHFPAVRPERPVVDTNGAGDAFVTAFLHSLFEGREVEECVLAGSVAGAFVCGAAGTHTEFIGLPELRAACARAACDA
jgi:sugar/nucleoside kinase (ribokinase family)